MLSTISTIVLLPLLFCVNFAFGANILLAYEVPSPSHQVWNYAFAEGLIKRGHNVTMFGPFVNKGKSSNLYHPLTIDGIFEVIHQHEEFEFQDGQWTDNVFKATVLLAKYSWIVCNYTYHHDSFRTLMNYPKDYKFDLIILDLSMSPCFYPLIQRFSYSPTIAVTAFLLPSILSDYFGNAYQPSYVPLVFTDYTENMNFFQRVNNYLGFRWDTIVRRFYEMRNLQNLAKRFFGDDLEPLESLEKHISLLMCGLDPVLTSPQPLPPNIIQVGGLNTRDARPLPTDLKNVMDNATEGVIFFALGTNTRSDNLGSNIVQELLDAFSKLKQTVVWKYESKIDNLPKNVLIRDWLPQIDILGHPNTKLFISHGGALSTFEAIYHGVPIIGMPLILDQRVNINTLIEKGVALKLNYKSLTSQEVLHHVNEILTNPKYLKKMKVLSARFRDQPQTPLERAIFWAEHAIRHKGARFLDPKARHLSTFVSSSTDVILFLISITFAFLYILFFAYKKMRAGFIPKQKLKEN